MGNQKYVYRFIILVLLIVSNVVSAQEIIVADFSNKKLPSSYWQTENTAYVSDRYGESAPSLQIKAEGYLMTNKITNLNEISFLCTRSNGGTNLKVQYSTNTIDFYDIATYTKDDIDKYDATVGFNAVTISDFTDIDSSNGIFIRFYSEKSSYYIDDLCITYGVVDSGEEIEKSEMPIFSATDGTSFGPEGLQLSITATDEALIYYNVNSEIDPTSDNALLYDGNPIALYETSIVKAIAIEPDKEPSDVATATYTFLSPSIDCTALFYPENIEDRPTADFCYTLPTGSNSSTKSLCGNEELLVGDVQLKFTVGVDGYTYSDGNRVRFYEESLMTILPLNGAVVKKVEMRRVGEKGCFILYSSDGEIIDNSTNAGAINCWQGESEKNIQLSSDDEIRFDYIMVTYEPDLQEDKLEMPEFNVVEGTIDEKNRFDESVKISLDCATVGALVEYKLSEEDEWVAYSEPLVIDQTTTIFMRASKDETIVETSVTFTYFKQYVSSIEEFKYFGPIDASLCDESNLLSTKNTAFTITSPLYVIAQKGERLFVTDNTDSFDNCLLIILKGNEETDKSFNRGNVIPAGTKGYYVNPRGIVPQLFIDNYDASCEGNTADTQCCLPEVEGTVVVTPLNVNVEDVLLVKTDGDYRFMSKFICASYSWFELENMTISVPVEESVPSDDYAPQRALAAGDVTVDIVNLFQIELPSQSGLASITGILDYSEENNDVVYIPLSFGIATSVDSLEIADEIKVEGSNLIVPEGAEVYTIDGINIKPNNLAPGIYIVRTSVGIAKVRIP